MYLCGAKSGGGIGGRYGAAAGAGNGVIRGTNVLYFPAIGEKIRSCCTQ